MSSLLRKLGVDRSAPARPPASTRRRAVPPTPPRCRQPSACSPTPRPSSAGRRAGRAPPAVGAGRAGHTLLAVVTGEAGMGKSRLVAEFAAEVHAGGGRVLLGACLEDVDEPYGPFVQAIVDDAARLEPAEVRRRAGDSGRGAGPPVCRRWPASSAARPGAAGPGTSRPSSARRWSTAIRHWLVGERVGGPTAARRRGPALVDGDDARTCVRELGRRAGPGAAAGRRHDPRHQARLRRRPGRAARRPRAVAGRRAAVACPACDRDEVGELVGATDEQAAGDPRRHRWQPAARHAHDVDVGQRSLPAWLVPARRAARRRGPRRARPGGDVRLGVRRRSAGGRARRAAAATCSSRSRRPKRRAWSCPTGAGRRSSAFVHALFRAHRYDALPLRRRLELHARGGDRARHTRRRRPRAVRAGAPRLPGAAARRRPARPSSWRSQRRSACRAAPTPTTKRSSTTGEASMRPASSIRRTPAWRST